MRARKATGNKKTLRMGRRADLVTIKEGGTSDKA